MLNILIALASGLLYSATAIAEFSVADKSWPKQLPPGDYTNQYPQSSATTESFNKDINNPGDIPAAEQQAINSMLPESEFERGYVNAGIYNNALKIASLKNDSVKGPFYHLPLASGKTNSKTSNSLFFALGYTFTTWRIDAALSLKQNVTYNPVPLFNTTLDTLSSKISTNNIIATCYYDFNEMYVFKPFIGLSAGVGLNKTTTTFDSTNRSNNKISPALGFQLGARTRIFNTNAFVGAAYRYMYLGSAHIVSQSSALSLKGQLFSSGFSLDLSYLL